MSRKSRKTAFATPSTAREHPEALQADTPLFADPTLRRWLPYLSILLLAFAFLSPALRGVYIWDDREWLLNCPVVKDPNMFVKLWLEPRASPQYYPLVFTTFWIEYRIWGLGSTGPDHVLRGVGYHVDNILLHIASALIIFHTLKRLRLPGGTTGAWLAALIFAIHPVNVESVAWVAERKNCLCGLFFFASLYFGLKFFRLFPESTPSEKSPADTTTPSNSQLPFTNSPASYPLYALALLLFIAAMLSKTTACILPPVFLLLIWWRRGKIQRREILLTLPLFLIAGLLGSLTAYLEAHQVGTTGPEWNFSILQRFCIAGTGLWFYLEKLFVPSPVMQVYPRFAILAGKPITNFLYYLAPLAYFALIAVLFALRKKISRGPVTAVLFFAGVLLPALGFINFYTMLYTFVADHYQYLACIGIIVLAVETLLLALKKIIALVAKSEPAPHRARLLHLCTALLSAAIILGLGTLSFADADLYSDSEALWGYNVEQNPKSFVAFANLAAAKINRTPPDSRGAVDALRAAIVAAPEDWRAFQTLGQLMLDANMTDKGIEYLTKAEALMPEVVRKNRATWFDARAKLVSEDPNLQGGQFTVTYGPHYLAAKHFEAAGQWDRAIAEYLVDRKDFPENIEAVFYLGNCYYAKGDVKSATDWFEQAIHIRPGYAEAWLRLGKCYFDLNRPDDAVKAILKARELDPNVVLKYPELTKAMAEQLRQQSPPREHP